MGIAFEDRVVGAHLGGAIGDGMGAPVEGFAPERVRERIGDGWDFTVFIPTQEWKPKGHGRITDDTLMTEALMRAYARKGDHLDAYDVRDHLLPEICDRDIWLPEWQKEARLIDRLNDVERYMRIRLRSFGAEPRTAGVGNTLNCAIAMYIMPVGAVNAGDPRAAYQEAAAFGLAESHAYAVEGAAALAAAYAAAFAPGATVDDVCTAALAVARDGTRVAIRAALDATDAGDDLPTWIGRVRAAVEPYDAHPDGAVLEESGARVGSYPDPRLAIEEVPVALAALRHGRGDVVATLRASVRYGRDCDSIAGMACGLAGALHGGDAIPAPLREASAAANRRDFVAQAQAFAAVCRAIHAADERRWAARRATLASARVGAG